MTHIRNFLIFDDRDEPQSAVIKIRDHEDKDRTITDPTTRATKTVKATELILEEADGEATSARYSILSDKLYAMFSPYLRDKSYRSKRFRLTVQGRGFRREYSLEILP